MEERFSKFDLSSFKKANKEMIASNEAAWDKYGGFSQLSKTKEYSVEEVKQIINSGSLCAQQNLSRSFFYKDGFYRKILIYQATLLKYSWLLIPNPAPGKKLSQTFFEKHYNGALDFLDNAGLSSILTNCSLKALMDGSYYGVIQKLDKENFALLDLPTQYCRSRFKDLKGNDVIEFDVRYFDKIFDNDLKKSALNTYPQVVSSYYKRYKKNAVSNPWVIIPTDIGICFVLFEGRPLFLNIIPSTIQYEESVEIERERDLEEIRKIIVQKIPHFNDGGLLFEPEEAEEIHKGTVGMMKQNKNVSVLTTYADVDSIVSKTGSEAVSNNLEKMVQNIYNQSGITSQLFSATGNLSINTSLKNDLALMMVLANKYSIFFTTLINNLFGSKNLNFKFEILPITYYNDSDYISDYFKLAQSGYSFIMPAIASGLTQRDLINVKELENNFLKLGEKLQPLRSAYTSSGNDEGGAPELPTDQKSEKTIANESSEDKQGASK